MLRKHLPSSQAGRCFLLKIAACATLFLSQYPLKASDLQLDVLYQLPLAPAGLTIAQNGNYLLSVSFEEKPENRVVEITRTGKSTPFPTEGISQGAAGEIIYLDAVEGMQTDKNGLVWMLDNGRRSEMAPKIVAWNYDHKKLHRVLYLTEPAVSKSSFLDDLVLDPEHPFLYIADPASGPDAALIVMDINTGVARRVLQGHPSVVPSTELSLVIDGQSLVTRRLDGSVADPQGGVNPMAVDRKGEWLYFGPMRSERLYRIRTATLRDPNLLPEDLAGQVEEYSRKPLCDGITIDSKGNIYVSDLANKAIGMINATTREYKTLITDARLLWPDGLCFGVDGKLYFFNNTRKSRPAVMGSGKTIQDANSANYLFRIQTPASGRIGD